jgi:flagellar motor component MotA
MTVDVEKTAGIIDTLRNMSSKELAVTIFLIVAAVLGAAWVENRYAKIKETNASIQETMMEIRKHKEEIIQMHVRTLELIRLQPKEVQETIDKNSRAFMENLKRLESSQSK